MTADMDCVKPGGEFMDAVEHAAASTWEAAGRDAQHEPPETIKPSPIGPHLAVPLTCRELEVLDLVCLGLANKAIALRLSISEGTVKNHLKNIYRKLSATNRTEAAMLHRHGF